MLYPYKLALNPSLIDGGKDGKNDKHRDNQNLNRKKAIALSKVNAITSTNPLYHAHATRAIIHINVY